MKTKLEMLKVEQEFAQVTLDVLSGIRKDVIAGHQYDREVCVIFPNYLMGRMESWAVSVGLTFRTTSDPTSAYFGLN